MRQALTDAADRQFRIHRADQQACGELPLPSRPTLTAFGFIDVIRRGLARNRSDTRPPVAEVTLVVLADDVNLQHVTTPDGAYVLAGCGEAPALRRPDPRPDREPASGWR